MPFLNGQTNAEGIGLISFTTEELAEIDQFRECKSNCVSAMI